MKQTDIIARIKRIEEEIEKRNSCPLAQYNRQKVHQKQMAFHKSGAKVRFVFGGNRTGKTECGAVETVWLARGIHPYRQNRKDVCCFVVSLSKGVQRDVAQGKILKYLDKRYICETVMEQGRKDFAQSGIIDYITVKNEQGGFSKIIFKSCEQGRDKFAGASLDFVWFDEEPPKDIFDECKMRLLDKKGFLFCTMTPLLGLTFVYDEIFLADSSDKEVWHTTMQWEDNPYLDKSEIDYFTSAMSEEELKARRYGQFCLGGGLVYPEFDQRVHVVEPFEIPACWQDNISIDPGLSNPLSCHWYAVDGNGVVYVIAEHYEAKRDISYHIDKIKNISQRLNWHTDEKGRISALIDSAAMQHTLASVRSVAELFWEGGIAVNPQVNKDLFSGINRVKAYLKNADGQTRLYIFSCCTHLIKEFKSYWWGEGERPKKCDDHAMDELRYYISSRPQPSKPPQGEKSVIEKDKERLIKKKRFK